jgi:DNA-binding protein H-NS
MPVTYGDDTHEAAVSRENFEKIDQMILARTYTSGPTKCHSSPSIVSGIAKCGPCIMAGYPPETCNLVIARDRKGGIARLRCARKKNQKNHACSTKNNIRLDTLLKHVMTRMFDHNLTGQNIKELIEEVTRKSSPYLEDKQKEKEDLYKSLAEVKKRIQNISEVIQTQGTRYQGMPTMLEDLAKLEKKRQTLEEKVQEINDATEEARLFINDPEGILAAVLDLRTYTETRDEEAAKELIKLFVTSIEVYDIQPLTKGNQEWRLDIQWTLPIFSERTDKSGDREIVILKKDDDDPQDDDFCLLGRFVGAHDAPRHRNRTTTADHAYDYGGGLLPFQRRVYRQRQPVGTPPRKDPSQQRREAEAYVQFRPAGACRPPPPYSHSRRYCRILFRLPQVERAAAAFRQALPAGIVPHTHRTSPVLDTGTSPVNCGRLSRGRCVSITCFIW